jgi:hypothetical protein
MHRIFTGAFAIAAASSTFASVVWDESVDGELSGDPLASTAVSFSLGENIVSGRVQTAADTRDYFTFTIGAGQSLVGIFLLDYVDVASGGNGDRGFVHIDEGATSVIPSGGTSGSFLGGSHLDRGVFPSNTTNVLDRLALAPQGGVGFTTPLGPGTYTFNVQQTGPKLTAYSLGFEVAPGGRSLAALGFGVLALLRRRRG